MGLNSINTNNGAMIALQNLNASQIQLAQTQGRISTGRKVDSAKDDGAVWAQAQNLRSTSAALNAVKGSLDRAQSTVDVALSGGSSVSDLLTQMKEKAVAAADTTLDTASRTALNEQFKVLRDQIAKTVANADFNGTNMIKASGTTIQALANADGSSKLTVLAQSLALAGTIVTVATTASFSTATAAATLITTLTTSITNVSTALAKMGAQSKAIELHATFISKLQDNLDAGVGNLVDADMAKESAKLQSLQSKQQLGIQALSIANQSTSALLGLFR